MKSFSVLGIMSGTSLDGVDYAMCAVRDGGLRLRELWSRPYPARLRRRIQAAADGIATSWEIGQLHHDLGRFYADGARPALAGRFRPTVVGLHGQTIFHGPSPTAPATLQIGEPAYLADLLRAPVVSNFRAADMAAGGQGAPLATAFHVEVFGVPGRHVCVNNLGGISNVTSIDWRRGKVPRVTAFDTGPANMLLDLAARNQSNGRRSMDRDGRRAARGRSCQSLVTRWLRHPFFRKAPPKSTGREMFGESFFRTILNEARARKLSASDLLASLTELTAQSIALNYKLHLASDPDAVVLAGGGARNPILVRAIGAALGARGIGATIISCEATGWPPESIEPAAFAWLAWLRQQGRPGNFPATTGASRPVICGQITAGESPSSSRTR